MAKSAKIQPTSISYTEPIRLVDFTLNAVDIADLPQAERLEYYAAYYAAANEYQTHYADQKKQIAQLLQSEIEANDTVLNGKNTIILQGLSIGYKNVTKVVTNEAYDEVKFYKKFADACKIQISISSVTALLKNTTTAPMLSDLGVTTEVERLFEVKKAR